MKFESQLQIVTAAGVPPFTVNQTALVINLNADLLDGQHGSYYAAASSLGNYLPLTGGTLTGTLTGTIGIFTTVRTTELTSLLGSNGPITITPDGTGHVHINSTDIRLGPNNTNATLATRGTGDLILRTNEGSAVEGFIRIYDGANGNIEITPNGTGTVVVGKLSGSTASFSGQVTSTVATGTAPLVIASTTAVANLNADLLDGQHGSYYLDTSAGAQTKSGSLTVNSALTSGGNFYAATTVQYSNRQQIYTIYHGGGQDLAWKKIADITIPTGLYRAVTFRVDVVDNQGNFGWNSDCHPMTFFASCRRSGGTQDSYNDAYVTGPVADYVRVVKTATGVYELQIRQLADWQTYIYTAEATINSGTTVTYVSSTPQNGSTTGTIYTASADWTQKLAKLVVAGASTFNSAVTVNAGLTITGVITTVASGTAINFSGQSDSFGYNATAARGTYIKGTGNTYVYGGGVFFDGSTAQWLLHAGNYSGYALPLTGGTITGQLSVNGSTASDILRLYTTGSTVWKLGVTDASGSFFNITADFGNFTINKSNGNVTTPGAFVSTVATGTAPLTVTSTTLVSNLNSQYLNGQLGSYYENRDTTAVGFSGGTLTLTRAAGNLTASLDGRYLPLTGGTLTGALNGTTASFSGNVKGGRVTLRDDCLEQHVDDSDGVGIFVNYFGYASGTTRFRNFGVFNGKNQQLFYITGSTGATAITGTLSVTGAITQNGNQVLHAGNVGTYALPIGGGTLTGNVTAPRFISNVATGTAPFGVTSTTVVTNLNADLLDGQDGSFYQNAGNLNAGTLLAARLPAFTGGDVTSSAGSAALTLVNSGVSAGTYRSVTVDAKGRVTAGTNPTTLGGYGITDAMYQVDPNGFTQGDINGSGNMQRLWGTDSVQNLIAFRPPTTVEYTTDNVNWIATTISNDVFDGKVFGKWGGFNMNVGSNIGAWTKVRMTWVNFGYHFFSHFTLCHSTNGHSMNFVFYKSDLNGVFSSEAYRVNGISSWPGYTFTSHVNVSGWWDTRDVRMVFELNGNNGPSGYPNNAISIGHIGIMGGYSSFNRVYDWDGSRNITLYGNLTLPGNVTAPRFISNVATGTAPLAVTSTTLVTNLNAQYLNGQLGSYYAAASSLSSYLPLTGGTLTGALIVNNDGGVRASYDSGGSYAWLYGYGVEFGRATSYVRPNTNRSATLFVGGPSINSNDWLNIDFYSSGRFTVNNNAILHAGNYTSYTAPNAANLPYSWSNTANVSVFSGSYSYNANAAKYLLLWQRTSGATGTNGRFVDGMLKVWRGANHAGNGGTVGYVHASSGYSGQSSEVLNYTPFTGQGLTFSSVVYNSVEWIAVAMPVSDYFWEFRGNYGIQGDTTTVPILVQAGQAGVGAVTNLATGSPIITSSTYSLFSSFTGTVSGSNFSGPGTGLTGLAAGLSIGGSAAQLNGQAASYYENRDTTAVGFSGGTLTLTRAAGNLTVSLDGRYLPLSGGTVNGNLTINGTLLVAPGTIAVNSLTDGYIGFGDPTHTVGWGVSQGVAGRTGDAIWAFGSNGSTGNTDTWYFGIGSASGGTFATAFRITQNGKVTFNSGLDVAGGALTALGNQVLHAGNYNSYAPTLTGAGASGNWPINITGQILRSAGVIADVQSPGSGTFNKHQMYANSTEFGIEAALATDAVGGVKLPIYLTWRGGYVTQGGLKVTGASSAELGGNPILSEAVVTFTPTTVGWYRIATAGGVSSGTIRITGVYDNRSAAMEFDYTVNGWNQNCSINVRNVNNYVGSLITQIRASNDVSTANGYLDIYIATATTPAPLTIYNFGPSRAGLVASPVVGAVVGTNVVRIATVINAMGFVTTGVLNGDTLGIAGNGTVGGTLAVTGAITQAGNQVLHAGNYNPYVLSASGTAASLTAGSANAIADGAVSTTAKLANSVVTYAKIQNVAVNSVLGNSSASVAQAPQEISMATLASLLSSQTLTATRLTNLTSTTTSTAGTDNSESCISYINGISLFGQTDGALYSHVYAPSWKHNIYGDYRTGQLAVRGKNSGTWQAWRVVLDSSNFNSYALPLSGGTLTGALNVTGIDQGLAIQHNGNAAAWYGRVITKNSTSDKASFLGTYGSIAGVFAHNNALTAWADIYINTVDGSTGGTVRMPSSVLINGNQALHAGTTSAPSLSIGGNAATATVATSARGVGIFDGTTYTAPNNSIAASGGRAVNLNPNTYAYGVSFEFKNASLFGFTGNYTGLITVAPWLGTTGSTGDPNYQLAFSPTAANSTSAPLLRIRAGIDTTWGSWATIIHDSNFATAIPNSGVGAGTYNNVTVNAKGIVTGGSNVGYLTGNQTITLSGDLSGSGTTSISATIAANAVTNAKIANSAVTYAKIQNVGAASVLGNPSASVSQAPQEITFGNLNNLLSGAAKAWVTFNENPTTGAITINASFNVSSITRINYGQYRVNFSTAFGDANYAISGTIGFESNGGYLYGGFLNVARSATPKTTTYCEVTASYGDGNTYNARYVHVVIDR